MADTSIPPSGDQELSKIFTKLWELDENKLESGKHFQINRQGVTTKSGRSDEAPHCLFSGLNEEVLSRPTYSTFIKLLDNYDSGIGQAEVVTEQEKQENWAFIDACLETKLMKEAQQYLKFSDEAFRDKLYDLWFKLHRWPNSDVDDSSTFEHVFVGETRGKRVLGFHNWVQFYQQEKAHNVDYQGYIAGTEPAAEDGGKPIVLTLQFEWKEKVKPIGSSFIGTSPEFELAVYTVLFFRSSVDETRVNIAGQDMALVCFKLDEETLGTCYPTLP